MCRHVPTARERFDLRKQGHYPVKSSSSKVLKSLKLEFTPTEVTNEVTGFGAHIPRVFSAVEISGEEAV